MRKSGVPRPHKRAGIWYLIRRVPADFAQLDRRGIVRMSTEIRVADDPRGIRAAPVVQRLNTDLETYWRGMRDGQSAEARIRFEAAQTRARALGVVYQSAGELAESHLTDIMTRLKMLVASQSVEDEKEVAAVLGGEVRPAIRLSGLLAEFEALQSARLGQMSEAQRRKWRNPKKRAAENLVDVVDDMDLPDLKRSHALEFRRWWQQRIAAEDLDIGTANKDIGHVAKMLRTVDLAHGTNVARHFAGLRIEGAVKKQRAAFTRAHVETKILPAGALGELNAEARDIVYMVAALGMRPSEVCGLDQNTIHIDAEIPFVSIEPAGRILKTEHSRRQMPLTGLALEVMKRNPAGFPRYREKADSLSALVNKVLADRKLLPTEDHSLYSLRHCFEDRLTAIDTPDKMIAVLMGHKHYRPKYGAGPTLAHKREWLDRIELTRQAQG